MMKSALTTWRMQGPGLIAQHWSEFYALLAPVETAIQRGRYSEAAGAAQIAAACAVAWHCGVFVSHRLKRALRRNLRGYAGQAARELADGRRTPSHRPRGDAGRWDR